MVGRTVPRYKDGDVIYKQCTRCGQRKEASLQFFGPRKRNSFGLEPMCRECLNAEKRQKRKDNPELTKEKDKQNYRKYKEKRNAYFRERAKNNKEYFLQRYQDNKDKMRQRAKDYYEKNKEVILEKSKTRKKEKGYVSIHNKVNHYMASKQIPRPPCVICGSDERVEAHHADYNKRNEVVFLCCKCHRRVHKHIIECPPPIDLLTL